MKDSTIIQLEKEISELLTQGIQPSHAQFVDRYPGRSEEIKALITTLIASRDSSQAACVDDLDPYRTIEIDNASTDQDDGGFIGKGGPRDSVALGVLGEFELLQILGRGGMGTVYLARDTVLGRMVALKTISLGNLSQAGDIARFHAEAESVAKLSHVNIASVFSSGESDGQHYISMQYVDGETLTDWKHRVSPDPKLAASIVRDIALAMRHAHERGVIHRDLKPGNVMIDRHDCVKIVDFGLAKNIGSDSSMTVTGQIMGTPSFMAPEQASGGSKNVTESVDVYAIGAILFFLLTGEPPFQGKTLVDTLRDVQLTPARPARNLNANVPLDLSTICSKCLEKNISNRYESAQALAEDLSRFLANMPVHARRIAATTRAWRWCVRNPLAAIFMLVVSSMLVGMTLLFVRANRAVADAEISFHRQIQTINELLVQIGSSDLKNIPNSQVIRSELLQKAEKFYAEARISDSTYSDIDDLHLQAATQLASVRGDIASTSDERRDALQQLQFVDNKLTQLIAEKPAKNSPSIEDAIATYSITPELQRRWEKLAKQVSGEVLLEVMRRSALTDNLVQQIRLQTQDPSKQVQLSQRVLDIRQQIATQLPEDEETIRLLAGAQHNLAESYRLLAAETESRSDLRQAIELMETAQQTRLTLYRRAPSDKLQFELAKGHYAIATTLIAVQDLDELHDATVADDATRIEGIRVAFQHAADGFAGCSAPPVFSQEARLSQAIALRELAMLGLQRADQGKLDAGLRLGHMQKSCDILKRLSSENLLVQRYVIEFLHSRSCLFRIVRMCEQDIAEEVRQSASLATDPASVDRDLNYARLLVIDNAPGSMECYLSLAQEKCMIALRAGSVLDARQTCEDAKSLANQYPQQVASNESGEPLAFFDEVLSALKD